MQTREANIFKKTYKTADPCYKVGILQNQTDLNNN